MNKGKQLAGMISMMVIVLIIATPLFVLNKRSEIYPYDVTQDYRYDFSTSNAATTPLDISNGKMTLPALTGRQPSVFVRLRVNATFLGNYHEPSISLTSGRESYTQYFERGAEGSRILNVSSLVSAAGADIVLTGKYLSLEDQTGDLIVFSHRDLTKSKVLVIAPHPDDAEIASFGFYSGNENSHIVTITAGEAGPNKYDEIFSDYKEQYLKKGQLRTWNSLTVPLLGGVPQEQILNLGFFDGTLAAMYRDKDRPAIGRFTRTADITTFRKQNVSSIGAGLHGGSDWNSLVGNLKYLLEIIQPDVIVTPHPVLDGHKDHRYSSLALFEAIKMAGLQEGQLYLYTNHYVLNEFYPYGKTGGTVSLPPNFGPDPYFDSIYSHPLSEANQKEKWLALEAMNDLRLDTEWVFFRGALKTAAGNIQRDIFGQDNSYFKRAVRSNELFFVTNVSSLYHEEKYQRLVGSL